jgi:hypothetical protein
MTVTSIVLNCPKCRAGMAHVSATPHPIVPGMQRNTFVCYGCNETRIYVLPAMSVDVVAK